MNLYDIIIIGVDKMFGIIREKNTIINESERIKGALFGFFVGDALGVPVEFVGRDYLKKDKVSKILEYGTHNQPVGTWSVFI